MAKKETEQQKMDKAFQKSTGMRVIPTTAPPAGRTDFAKDDPQYKRGKK